VDLQRVRGVELRLDTSMEVIDLETSEVDATIRLGGGPWPGGVLTRTFGELETTLVCAPALAESLHDLSDLTQHTILEIRGLRERGLVAGLRTAGIQIDPSRVQTFQSYYETVRAAEHGLGVATGMFPLTTHWVLQGRLAVPFAQRYVLPGFVALVHRARDDARFPFAALTEWLREEYAALPALPAGRITPRSACVNPA
jgi:DNA-binding transcriptional LysR family regulator